MTLCHVHAGCPIFMRPYTQVETDRVHVRKMYARLISRKAGGGDLRGRGADRRRYRRNANYFTKCLARSMQEKDIKAETEHELAEEDEEGMRRSKETKRERGADMKQKCPQDAASVPRQASLIHITLVSVSA